MLSEKGKKVVIVAIISGILYYCFGPVGPACVALVLLLKKANNKTET